jgi:hypothetical protein
MLLVQYEHESESKRIYPQMVRIDADESEEEQVKQKRSVRGLERFKGLK